jgi:hypothetical protein
MRNIVPFLFRESSGGSGGSLENNPVVNAQQLPVLRNVLPLLDHGVRGQASAPYVYDRLRELVGDPKASFRVALRSEPSNLSVAGHPIVNVSFADKAADNPNFRARDTGLNLPVSFSDPFWLECDARGFFHPDNMALKPKDS